MGAVFRLNKILPAAREVLLKADEAAEFCRANDLVRAAQQRAQEREAQAEQAYEARFQQGLLQGMEQGRAEQAVLLLEQAASNTQRLHSLEERLVGVVLHAVRRMVGEIDDAARARGILQTALAGVRDQERVTARVAPGDETALLSAMSAFLPEGAGRAGWLSIVADSRLKPGDCVLESAMGVVNAGLETRLAALEQAMLARLEGREAEDEKNSF